MLRWIENCTAEQSAQIYHKFDKARGSDFARVVVAQLDATETMEKELVNIARAVLQGKCRTVETDYGFVLHDCWTDDVMKGQSK